MFVVAAIAFTIVMTWVFNNTKGSLFMAVLVHTSFDMVLATLNGLFPTPLVNDYGSNVPILIGFGALAVVLVAVTRGRLGYQYYQQEKPNSAADLQTPWCSERGSDQQSLKRVGRSRS
jgi:hypothetical protein